MKRTGREHFTPDEYHRLSRNPFVDRQMLQFVRNRTVTSAGTAPVVNKQPRTQERLSSPRRQVQISESAARLIAMTIRAMLRE